MLVSFEVDLSDPLQLEFAKWYEKNPGSLKEATMLGHYILTHGVEQFYKTFYEINIVDVKEREWQEKMRIAVATNNASHDSKVVHLKDRVSDLENQLRAVRMNVDQEVERRSDVFKQQVHELQATLTSMVKDGQVEQLRTTIAEREAELKVLKSSNHMKGVTGEKLIMKYLERHFPNHAINHTAFKAAEADIHMTNTDGEVIIIESKYKERITTNDVEKFYRDLSEVSKTQRCCGAVFVSVVNRSIPNKGSLCIEKRCGVPVMFVAFDSEAELQEHLVSYLTLFMDVSAHFQIKKEDESNDELLVQMTQYFGIINKNREKLASIRETCMAPMERMLREVSDNNQKLLVSIESLLHKHGKNPVQKKAKFICKDCGQEFVRAGDLTSHTNKKHRTE